MNRSLKYVVPLIAVLLMAVLPFVSPPAEAQSSTVAFEEDFSEASSMNRFRFMVHNAGSAAHPVDSWQGDHDLSCNGPTTTRTIQTPAVDPVTRTAEGHFGTAYWCAPGGPATGHMMTSFFTHGYVQVDFSPDQQFEDVRRICWDQNQTDLGNRKWSQLVVVSESTFVANGERMDYVLPHIFDGPGSAGVPVNDEVFLMASTQGRTRTIIGDTVDDFGGGIFLNEDKAQRFRTCVEDLGNGTVRIELERYGYVEVRTQTGWFPQGPARVIFQDDAYNPSKSPAAVPEPWTWHWDNIRIETGPPLDPNLPRVDPVTSSPDPAPTSPTPAPTSPTPDPGQGNSSTSCGGRDITVNLALGQSPTNGADVILGTSGNDVINGLGGDDVICAGDGDDTIYGGPGHDLIFAGYGVDRIYGGDGNDIIYGEGGSDRVYAMGGRDTVWAGSGADHVWGGDGNDTLNGMGGQDTMWGGSGNDEMQGNHQSDILHGGSGDDTIRGATGKDKLYGEGGNDDLFGGDNTDYLDGGPGTDTANGQAGRDSASVAGLSGCIAETTASC